MRGKLAGAAAVAVGIIIVAGTTYGARTAATASLNSSSTRTPVATTATTGAPAVTTSSPTPPCPAPDPAATTAAERWNWPEPVQVAEFDDQELDPEAWSTYRHPDREPGHAPVTVGEGTVRITDGDEATDALIQRPAHTHGRWEARVRARGTGAERPWLLWFVAEDVPVGGMVGLGAEAEVRHLGPDGVSSTADLQPAAGEWHTVALEWLPDEATYFVDGEPVLTIRDPAAVPTEPLHFAIAYGADPESSRPRQGGAVGPGQRGSVVVDWVRRYDAGAAQSPCGGGSAAPPTLDVATVADGLDHAWGLDFLPGGRALVTERAGRLRLLDLDRGSTIPVEADLSDVFVEGEAGLLGVLVHPDFAETRRFTTCQTHGVNGRAVDVRLVTWELSADSRRATRVVDPLVSGLPLHEGGRHAGCGLALGQDGTLFVGTGDAATATVPQDLGSLGGKVLRVNLATGDAPADNPFAASPNAAQRLIYTYGHRNVQGLAVHPTTGEVYAAEHGPDWDDEINLLRAGGNYGWDPSRGNTRGGYDENVPMTDLRRYPDAIEAAWRSGSSTEAISGATFLDGPQWGRFDGALAVAALNGQKLLVFTVDGRTVGEQFIPVELDGTFGRLRGVRQGPDGALYITTSNGDTDRILRVTAT